MSEAEDLIDVMGDPGASQVSIAEVLRCVMHEFGGAAGFAKQLKLDFQENNAGSANRIRIESDILKALQHHGEPEDDGGDIKDLEAQARQLMQRDDGNDD
jgi:hypothetical protein